MPSLDSSAGKNPNLQTARSALGSSFRDPSGFVFREHHRIIRQVNPSYQTHYDHLMASGLYQTLVNQKLLIPHTEITALDETAYRWIEPERVRFVSYPYEWCFSQLKDAALVTLEIQRQALEHDMILKDASAFNIQFHHGHPVLIDTLSFEKYVSGRPWVAYRQFCQHFLAPLALMANRDVQLSRLLRIYLDGLPLEIATKLLPLKARFSPALITHLFLQAASQRRHQARPTPVGEFRVSKAGLQAIVSSLRSATEQQTWKPQGTEWSDYYDHTNYGPTGLDAKASLVKELLSGLNIRTLWDLGANNGRYSRLASQAGIETIALDKDAAAIEKLYISTRRGGEPILPLVMDLTNPSPALGWAGNERESLTNRGPADCVMALALVHHLAIGHNIPLPNLVSYFSQLGRWLIVEFVPKHDSQVMRLLHGREDVFNQYSLENFETELRQLFRTVRCVKIPNSERVLFLAERLKA